MFKEYNKQEKREEIERQKHLLNGCLNDALISRQRIKGIPNSNKIAEFVNKWLEKETKV